MERRFVSDSEVQAIVHSAFAMLSLQPNPAISDGDRVDSYSLDSLGMSQLILFIEDETGFDINDEALEKLAASKVIGDVTRLLLAVRDESVE